MGLMFSLRGLDVCSDSVTEMAVAETTLDACLHLTFPESYQTLFKVYDSKHLHIPHKLRFDIWRDGEGLTQENVTFIGFDSSDVSQGKHGMEPVDPRNPFGRQTVGD